MRLGFTGVRSIPLHIAVLYLPLHTSTKEGLDTEPGLLVPHNTICGGMPCSLTSAKFRKLMDASILNLVYFDELVKGSSRRQL